MKKIEPTVFLTPATATLAYVTLLCLGAAGCEVYVGDRRPQSPNGPQQASAAPSSAVPPAALPPPPTAAPSSPTPPPAAAQQGKVIPIHLHGATSAPAGSSTSTPSSQLGTAPSAACLDNGPATVGDCGAARPPDPSCLGASLTQQRCAASKAYFAPKVAAAAVSCMTALSSQAVCDPSQSDNCAKAALAQACPDSSVAQLCGIAAASCKSNASDCTALLSGLTNQAKAQVAQCVAQGCSAGLYACILGQGR
jgi:hypothetical protein